MKKPGLHKSAEPSPLNEKPFEVELIIAGILGGCLNNAAESKALAFVGAWLPLGWGARRNYLHGRP